MCLLNGQNSGDTILNYWQFVSTMTLAAYRTHSTNSSSRVSASYNATRQSQTENFFLWWWLQTLHQRDVRMVYSLWRWYLGILFDAQSHTSHSSPTNRWGYAQSYRRYARMINFREDWRGYLWQGRFHLFVMDESYVPAAARYIELNPVRAQLVTDPIVYPWSSARAHSEKRDDVLVRVSPLLELIADWDEFLKGKLHERQYQ